jgi:hypothetical protein
MQKTYSNLDPHLVAYYDTQGDNEDLFLAESSQDCLKLFVDIYLEEEPVFVYVDNILNLPSIFFIIKSKLIRI